MDGVIYRSVFEKVRNDRGRWEKGGVRDGVGGEGKF